MATLSTGDPQLTITSKTDVVRALATGFQLCDAYFNTLPDNSASASADVASLIVHYTSMADFLSGHLRAKGLQPLKE